jgi:hypothetical protein
MKPGFQLGMLKPKTSQSSRYTFTKQAEKSLNKRLPESWWKLFPGTGQERSADGGIHAIRDHSNVRSYCDTLKKLRRDGHSEQKSWKADVRCSAPPRQCASACSYSHSNTAWAFQLGIVWPPSLQPLSCSGRTTSLPTLRTGWDHSASTIMRSSWKVSECGWVHFFHTGVQKLILRYDKCLNSGGDCVEK